MVSFNLLFFSIDAESEKSDSDYDYRSVNENEVINIDIQNANFTHNRHIKRRNRMLRITNEKMLDVMKVILDEEEPKMAEPLNKHDQLIQERIRGNRGWHSFLVSTQ